MSTGAMGAAQGCVAASTSAQRDGAVYDEDPGVPFFVILVQSPASMDR